MPSAERKTLAGSRPARLEVVSCYTALVPKILDDMNTRSNAAAMHALVRPTGN
jgi:hypothetical protein